MTGTTIAAELEQFLRERPSVGIVVGLIDGGSISEVHAAGTTHLGTQRLPDVDSVYRIASMTKSFTAAAVLLLRDRGQLGLDDAVSDFLPWMSPRNVTVRDLLTMNAGFPTDDPWGDRHEPTALQDFDALVASEVPTIRDPRTGFEYSNLSYALLGRVISAVSDDSYPEFVTRELLRPLGMTSTVFDYREIPGDRRVQGYHETAVGFVEEPQTPPGAFSPMGGLHSSVRDLARWVHGLNGAWQGDEEHPLSIASRREMQSPQNFARLIVRSTDDPVTASSLSYGFGLLAEEHSAFGRFVHHSGGYPGFGSHMRWHPDTGLGIVALSNRTYAAPVALCERLFAARVSGATPRHPISEQLWSRTREAMDVAEQLLQSWDDTLADEWFAHNLDLDTPRSERRDTFEALGRRAGEFTRSPETLQSRSAAHARWSVVGNAGSLWVEVLMSPDPTPRIQHLNVTEVQ